MSYHFINAFRFVDDSGKVRTVRYEMRAREPEAFLDDSAAKAKGPGYLREELTARLARGPVLFDYIAHVAAPGDITSDPTSYWPTDRPQVVLGTLTVRSVVTDSDVMQRTTLFDPGRLTPGIEFSDDPMLSVRSQSYAISFSRRTQ
jgi:catalase